MPKDNLPGRRCETCEFCVTKTERVHTGARSQHFIERTIYECWRYPNPVIKEPWGGCGEHKPDEEKDKSQYD